MTTLHPASPLLLLRARACACTCRWRMRVFVEPPRQTGNPKTVQTLKDHAALQGLKSSAALKAKPHGKQQLHG